MKLLIIGCGSIGRRHLNNATKYGDVGVYDNNPETLSFDNKKILVFSDLQAAISWQPDGVIIATPPNTHVMLATYCIEAGIPTLIEKPISNKSENIKALLEKAKIKKIPLYVACNMRFHSAIETLRQNLPKVGKPLFARAYYGNYLPNMRPNVDYRRLYASNRDQGGGVTLDAIHEIDYLRWFFGEVESVTSHIAKLSNLEINVEDYAHFILQHKNGFRSEVHLDFLQQCKRRGCEIVGTDGTLIWQSENKNPENCIVRLFLKEASHWITIYENENENANNPYDLLIQHFINGLYERNPILSTGEEGFAALSVALAALKVPNQQNEVEHGSVTLPS